MVRNKLLVAATAGLLLVAVTLAVVQVQLQREAEARVAAFVDQLPSTVEMQYASVETGLFQRSVIVNDVSLTVVDQPPLRVERVHIDDVDLFQQPPSHLRVRLQGVGHPVRDLPPEQAEALKGMGYAELVGDYEFEYTYDAGEQQLQIKRLQAAYAGMGELRFSTRLHAFNLQTATEQPLQALLDSRLAGFEIGYADHGLVAQAIHDRAARQGLSETEVLERLSSEIIESLQSYRGEFFRELSTALPVFLRDRGRLVVRAAPAQPFAVMDIVGYALVRPMEIPRLLRMSVLAEEAGAADR